MGAKGLSRDDLSPELSATAGEPSSIPLIDRLGVREGIEAATDGSKMAGDGSLASLRIDVEVNGRGILSTKDQRRLKSRAILECELQLNIGRKFAHILRMRFIKRRYM